MKECGEFSAATCPTKPMVTRGWSVIELAKSEAVTQGSPISANLFVAIMAEV